MDSKNMTEVVRTESARWVEIFISQSSNSMIFWNIYIVVALGVIGYIAKEHNQIQKKTKKLIAGVWVIFSISNIVPLYQNLDSLSKIYEKLGIYSDLFTKIEPQVGLYCHIFFDVCIFIFILIWGNKGSNKA